MKQTAGNTRPLLKRIRGYLPQRINPSLKRKVESCLVDVDEETLDTKSKGASAFFSWVSTTCAFK